MPYASRALCSCLVAVGLLATTAHAGGLSFVEFETLLGPGNNGLRNAEELAIGPDGANLYTASNTEDSLGVFTRNPGTNDAERFKAKGD